MISALVAALVCIAPAAGTASPAPTTSTPAPAASAPAGAATPSTTATTTATSSTSPSTSLSTAPPAERSRLLLHPAADGTVTVRDPNGRVAASVIVRGGQDLALDLAPGRYSVTDDTGTTRAVELQAGSTLEHSTTRAAAPAPARPVAATPAPEGPAKGPAPTVTKPPPRKHPHDHERRHGGSGWKRIVAPLMSATIPGSGQILNGQPGKGVGMFLGTASLGAGALALYLTRNPLDNSSPGLNGSTFGAEVVNGAGFGLLTGALSMLYAAQIMDAYGVAAHAGRPKPATRHRFSLQLTRMATVGFRAGDPAAAYYPDWGFNFQAQVYKRLSVGLSDLSLKYGTARTTVQGGVRLSYRFYDKGRLWVGGSLGLILQGTAGRRPRPLGDVVSASDRTSAFAAIPYAQLDLRLFFLDHWSLDLIPRVSAPFGTRFYRRDLALPSHAATFELGTGVGVVF
ncbi:MAG: hypothetical protein R3B09_11135 [Nannocystaceae bacterium]